VSARRWAWLLLAPALAVLAALVLAPQAVLLVASLWQRSAYGGLVHQWTLANYLRALEPMYLSILARSLGLAALTTLLCLLAGWPVAYWLGRRVTPRLRQGLLVLVVLPFWTSFLVRMYAWIFLLRDEGLVNEALRALGLPALPLLYNDFAVMLGQLYGELPFMILPLYASLEKLEPALLEAAADLGASPARRLWRVTVPLAAPGIAAGCLLVFIPSLGAFLAPDLLGGGRAVYAGNLVQSQFAVARDMPFGSAVSFLLTLVVLALLWLFRRPLRAAGEA
jgi:spermidine/putrescine transport system permease protein